MKTRILFVNGNLAVGGVERALVSLLKALDYEKYNVDLLLLQPGDDYLCEIPEPVNVIKKDTSKAYGSLAKTLAKALIKGDFLSFTLRFSLLTGFPKLKFLRLIFGLRKCYDVAISFRPGFCEEVVLNVVTATKKFTWWHHGNLNIAIPKKKLISNWTIFDKVITVSDSIAVQIRMLDDRIADKVEIIPNIIDIEHIRNAAGVKSPYSDTDKLKIITVSRLSEEKNLHLIVDTASELKSRGFNFEWSIIGEGDVREQLENEIKNNNLTGSVVLRGQKDNPYSWIKFADIMVHPSTVESFGIVLLEAMALGTPCISAPSLGAKDLINGKNGIIVNVNVKDMAKQIAKIIIEKTIVSNKEDTVETLINYSPNKVINNFSSLIEK